MTKLHFLFSISLISSVASANFGVHVGNGGGEAEMKIVAMAPAAMLWAKACNENPGVCGDGASFNAVDAKIMTMPVGFAPASPALQSCGEKQITIAHEDLYLDGTQPKPDSELAKIMIERMLTCSGWNRPRLNGLSYDQLLPVAQKILDLPFAVLTGKAGDIIVAIESTLNAQGLLTQTMNCKNVRVVGAETNGFKVRCLDDSNSYLVMVRPDPSGFRFVSKAGEATY